METRKAELEADLKAHREAAINSREHYKTVVEKTKKDWDDITAISIKLDNLAVSIEMPFNACHVCYIYIPTPSLSPS